MPEIVGELHLTFVHVEDDLVLEKCGKQGKKLVLVTSF